MASSLIQTGPTPADTAVTFIPFVPASLSILGASAILYNILSDPRRRFTSPYFRIMFGLITADVIFSMASMTSTFMAPKDTPFLYYAVGNQTTCDVQGFLLHLSVIQALYTACLAVYYLVTIKYNVSDDHIAQKYEVWMHAISILYPLLGSIVCVGVGVFNPTPSGCRIAPYPPKCDFGDKAACIRGANATIYLWVFTGSVLNICLALITICMSSIIFFVKRRERIMNRRFSFGNHRIARSDGLIKQSKQAMVQGLFYVGSFILVWIFSSVYSFVKSRPVALIILSQFFWPLQGFFNSLIYFWPRYTKTRNENQDKSFFWVIKDMIVTTTFQKEQRRAVLHSVRRRRGSGLFSARRDQDKDVSATTTRNFTSLDLASSAVPLENNDIMPADMDGDPVVMLQRLRSGSDYEADHVFSEQSSEKVDEIILLIAATQSDMESGNEEDASVISNHGQN